MEGIITPREYRGIRYEVMLTTHKYQDSAEAMIYRPDGNEQWLRAAGMRGCDPVQMIDETCKREIRNILRKAGRNATHHTG